MQKTEKYKLNLIEKTDTFSPDPLNENMEKVEKALSGGLEAEAAARQIADAAEAQARAEADAAEVRARTEADTAEAQTRAAADTAEAQARTKADAAEAQTRAAADTAEAQARTKADAALDQRLKVIEAHHMVLGSYTPGSQRIDINLGFHPKAVMAMNPAGFGALMLAQNAATYEGGITSSGFYINPAANNAVLNRAGTYSYIAFD